MIRVIFFDLDGTLVAQEEAFAGAYKATAGLAAEAAGVDADAFARAIPDVAASCFDKLRIAKFVRRCRFGGRDVLWGDSGGGSGGESDGLRELRAVAPVYREDVWATLLTQHSVSNEELHERLDVRFRDEMAMGMAAFAEVEEVLMKLSSRYRLAIITNGMPAAQTQKVRRLGLEKYFEAVTASAEVGAGKPASEIFRHALAVMGVSANESVMVGDSLDGDVNGARQAGMASCWVQRGDGVSTGDAVGVPTIANLSGVEALLDQALWEQTSLDGFSWFGRKAVSVTR